MKIELVTLYLDSMFISLSFSTFIRQFDTYNVGDKTVLRDQIAVVGA